MGLNKIGMLACLAVLAFAASGYAYCVGDVCYMDGGAIIRLGTPYTPVENPDPPAATYTCTASGNEAFKYGIDECVTTDVTHVCNLETCTLGEVVPLMKPKWPWECGWKYFPTGQFYCFGTCPGPEPSACIPNYYNEQIYCDCFYGWGSSAPNYKITCGPSAVCEYDAQTDTCSGEDAETHVQCVREMMTIDGVTKPTCMIPDTMRDGETIEMGATD